MSESIRRRLRRALPLLLAASAAGLSLYFARAEACSGFTPMWRLASCERPTVGWDGERLTDAETRDRVRSALQSGRAQYWAASDAYALELSYEVAEAFDDETAAHREFSRGLIRLAVCAPGANVDVFETALERIGVRNYPHDLRAVAALGLLRAGDEAGADELMALIDAQQGIAGSAYPAWMARSGSYRALPRLLSKIDRIGKTGGSATQSQEAIALRSTLIDVIPHVTTDTRWRAKLNQVLLAQLHGLHGKAGDFAFRRLKHRADPRYFDPAVLDWMLAEHFAASVYGDDGKQIPDEILLRLGLAAEPEPGPEDVRALDNLSCSRFSVRQEHWRDEAMVMQWQQWSLRQRDDVSRWHWSRTDQEDMSEFRARLRQQMDLLLDSSLAEEQWLSALTLAKRRYLRLDDVEMLTIIRDLRHELPLPQAAWAEQFLISHADGAGTEYLEALAASDKRTERLMAAEILASIPQAVWQTRSAPQPELCTIVAQLEYADSSIQHCGNLAEAPSHVESVTTQSHSVGSCGPGHPGGARRGRFCLGHHVHAEG